MPRRRTTVRRRPIPPKVERFAAFHPPDAIARSFESFIAQAMNEFRALIKEYIDRDVLDRLLRTDAILPDYMRQRFGAIELRFAELFEKRGKSKILDRAYDTGLGVSNLTDRQWQKLVGKTAIGVNTAQVSQHFAAEFAVENSRRITSVAGKHLAEVYRLCEQAVRDGERPEKLAAKLEERFEVSKSRARLIARDQTLKYHAKNVQNKQTQAGVVRYIWTTSNAENVRETHAALEGQEFRWDDPPITNDDGDTNHPGEDYQCRCIAYPVIPWLDDNDWGLGDLRSTVAVPRLK